MHETRGRHAASLWVDSIICLPQCDDACALGNVNVMSNILHFSSNMTAITEGNEGGEEVNGLLQVMHLYLEPALPCRYRDVFEQISGFNIHQTA